MKNLDFDVLNQKYSISQLRAVPEYLALIKTDAHFKTKLQIILRYLLTFANIDKSSGFLLDYLGWLLGISREYFNVSEYFSYNRADVNTEKYVWFSEPESDYIVPAGTLDDVNFRARIKAKAYANHSKCTREDNIAIIKNMTFADKVIIENVAPLTLDITLIGSNLFITQNLQADIESVLGRGVGIRNLEIQNGD